MAGPFSGERKSRKDSLKIRGKQRVDKSTVIDPLRMRGKGFGDNPCALTGEAAHAASQNLCPEFR